MGEITEHETRLREFISLYGYTLPVYLTDDLRAVLDLCQQLRSAYLDKGCQAKAMAEMLAAGVCQCHERDGSYVCEYCRQQGMKGHMQ